MANKVFLNDYEVFLKGPGWKYERKFNVNW